MNRLFFTCVFISFFLVIISFLYLFLSPSPTSIVKVNPESLPLIYHSFTDLLIILGNDPEMRTHIEAAGGADVTRSPRRRPREAGERKAAPSPDLPIRAETSTPRRADSDRTDALTRPLRPEPWPIKAFGRQMSLILWRYGGRFPSAGYDKPPESAKEGGDGDKTRERTREQPTNFVMFARVFVCVSM